MVGRVVVAEFREQADFILVLLQGSSAAGEDDLFDNEAIKDHSAPTSVVSAVERLAGAYGDEVDSADTPGDGARA